jgi:hypothetical protein
MERQMLLQVISLLISSLPLSQGSALNTDNPLKPYEDAEAYEVYSAILPMEWPWQAQKAKTLVIQSETQGHQMCVRLDAESEKIIGQAISEYVKLNEKTWLLQRQFSIERPYELIAYNEFKSGLLQGDWENLLKRYPDSSGWIILSAVGFNADKTVAVVSMTHHSWGPGDGGGFHVLQKKNGKWVPLKWKGTSCGWGS